MTTTIPPMQSNYPKEITKTITFLAQDAADEAFLADIVELGTEIKRLAEDIAIPVLAIDGTPITN